MQTNSDGKLHGEYTSWNDAGEIVENGNYRNGEKHGTWLITSENGLRETLHYNNGILQEP
jgi:antitoxin component YwqK of YwqJK toxin-antitoxin module